MNRHIAVYVRVSTRQQDTKSQEPDLQRWLSAFAIDRPERWYTDKASGKSMCRPGWLAVDRDIELGKVETVVCWRLDRLGRTASGLTALFEKLTTKKINLVSVRDGIDLSTPAGRLIANVLASVAAYETEVRGERVAAGQAVARAAGKRWGGSMKGRRLKVTNEQVSTIQQMHRSGATKSAMARATGLSRPTVYRLLQES